MTAGGCRYTQEEQGGVVQQSTVRYLLPYLWYTGPAPSWCTSALFIPPGVPRSSSSFLVLTRAVLPIPQVLPGLSLLSHRCYPGSVIPPGVTRAVLSHQVLPGQVAHLL